MSRSVPEWIGKSDDTPVPPRVRLRNFLKFEGICQICKLKIEGKVWITDHKDALILGGENRESNLQPIHETCDRKVKTPADVAEKSDAYRRKLKAVGIKRSGHRPIIGSRASGWKKKMDGTVVRR